MSAALAGFVFGGLVLKPTAKAAGPALAPVYVGGVTTDMQGLADPRRTALLRAAGGAFYAHESYILQQTRGRCPDQGASATLGATIGVFSKSPPPLAEIGFSTALAVSQLIQCNYHAVGLHPEAALVNIDMEKTTVDTWRQFVDAARMAGVRILGPVISPNVAPDPLDWSDPYWAASKKMALIGGALGMDTPPLLYKSRGLEYVHFAQQQLSWCALNRIPCIDIISPSDGENTFTPDSVAWANMVVVRDIRPASWVVENYVAGTTPSIGGEREKSSVVNSALVLAHYRPGKETVQ